MEDKRLQFVKDAVKSYPDFPKPGILFRDIFSVMRDPEAFKTLLTLMVEHTKSLGTIDVIVGLDSRGFLIAPHIALSLGIPFVPIRKKGKLPGPTSKMSFSLEYGEDVIEIQKDSIKEGQSVLVVDDLIATGGTLNASCKLIESSGGKIVECFTVMELSGLDGRSKINYPVYSLIVY